MKTLYFKREILKCYLTPDLKDQPNVAEHRTPLWSNKANGSNTTLFANWKSLSEVKWKSVIHIRKQNRGIYNYKCRVCFLYSRGGQPVREQEPHFLLCYCKEPHHMHGHTWTAPIPFSHSLALSHTHTRTSAQPDLL